MGGGSRGHSPHGHPAPTRAPRMGVMGGVEEAGLGVLGSPSSSANPAVLCITPSFTWHLKVQLSTCRDQTLPPAPLLPPGTGRKTLPNGPELGCRPGSAFRLPSLDRRTLISSVSCKPGLLITLGSICWVLSPLPSTFPSSISVKGDTGGRHNIPAGTRPTPPRRQQEQGCSSR